MAFERNEWLENEMTGWKPPEGTEPEADPFRRFYFGGSKLNDRDYGIVTLT